MYPMCARHVSYPKPQILYLAYITLILLLLRACELQGEGNQKLYTLYPSTVWIWNFPCIHVGNVNKFAGCVLNIHSASLNRQIYFMPV